MINVNKKLMVLAYFEKRVHYHADGLVQNCSNSIAYALELLQSCTEP